LSVESPCINVCRIHAERAVCRGCYRTLDEIAEWSQLADQDKRRVVAELAVRRTAMGPLNGGE